MKYKLDITGYISFNDKYGVFYRSPCVIVCKDKDVSYYKSLLALNGCSDYTISTLDAEPTVEVKPKVEEKTSEKLNIPKRPKN